MTASRRRADPRLFIGLLLVLASVAGVVAIVAAADRRTPVYALAASVAPGTRLDGAQLVERSVALDGSDGDYVPVGALPSGGVITTRALQAGELLPVSALGSPESLASTSLVLDLAAPVSEAVQPGAQLDLWRADPADALAGAAAVAVPPSVLVSGAVFVRAVDDGQFGSDSGTRVELLLPRDRVALVLQAVADGAKLAVVPAGLPWSLQ